LNEVLTAAVKNLLFVFPSLFLFCNRVSLVEAAVVWEGQGRVRWIVGVLVMGLRTVVVVGRWFVNFEQGLVLDVVVPVEIVRSHSFLQMKQAGRQEKLPCHLTGWLTNVRALHLKRERGLHSLLEVFVLSIQTVSFKLFLFPVFLSILLVLLCRAGFMLMILGMDQRCFKHLRVQSRKLMVFTVVTAVLLAAMTMTAGKIAKATLGRMTAVMVDGVAGSDSACGWLIAENGNLGT
jgi:hypothetical protein